MIELAFAVLFAVYIWSLLKYPRAVDITGKESELIWVDTVNPFRPLIGAPYRRTFVIPRSVTGTFYSVDAFDPNTGKKASLNDWHAINKVVADDESQKRKQSLAKLIGRSGRGDA
jgi:hypothetical protein